MALTDYVLMPRADYVGMCDKMREIKETSSTFTSGQLLEEMASIKEGGTDVEVLYVYFMSHDGTKVLHKRAVLAGNDCMEVVSGGVIDAPTRESSNTEVYTFAGWSLSKNGTVDANALKNVTANRYVYAVYTASTRYYTISYYDVDTLLKTKQLVYGAMPDYEPEKIGYAFIGWEPALTKVVGDAVYYAQWQEAEVILYSGTCGEKATWIINAAGTLRISGTGATYDYAEFNSSGTTNPWRSLGVHQTITSIEIGEGITELGEYLFAWVGASGGITITLPESLKTIAYRAFLYCTITSITIPRNVTSIESRAFERCSTLTDMTILCAAQWGTGIFYSASQARSNIYINDWGTWLQNDFDGNSENVMTYHKNFYVDGVLYDGGDLVIPNGITTIGAYVCYNLGIKNLTVPASVLHVGKGAFEYTGYTSSEQLQSIHYEGDIAGWCEIVTADATSFDMASTTKLYIDGNLVTGDLVIPDGILAINAGAFAYQTGITSVTLPDSLKIVGSYAFGYCHKINTVTYKGTLAEWCEVQHGTMTGDYLRMAPNVYVGGSLLSGNIVIPDGITEVPAGLLYNKTGVTGISIPAGVTKIGSYACYGCTGLTSLSLPDSLTWIADHAFQMCSGIKSVTIPAAVEKISGYAFADSGLTSVTFEDTSGTWYAGKYTHSTTVGSYNTKLSGVPTLTYFTGSTYQSYYLTRAS